MDDDETIRELLRYRFEREGYEIEVFVDGMEATNALVEGDVDPDLIIVDVMMPRLDGKRLLRRIRAGDAGVDSDTPVIMLTSRGREEDVLGGFDSGADDYMTKPFSPAELVARVRRHLNE
ncbi:response regulator transcription factor [Halobaculum sp. EA56]|uniref:response regulator transcription factor n=1 Tax=Halobaculum sp. EA56 TaxID=3421648 RepID=UPI003EBB10F1